MPTISQTGLQQGMADEKGRGVIIKHIVAALRQKRPRPFVLENVRGLVSRHAKTFVPIGRWGNIDTGDCVTGSVSLVEHKLSRSQTDSVVGLQSCIALAP